MGNVSTDCQYKRFSSTDDYFFGTVGIWALKCVSTGGTVNDPIVTENLYWLVSTNLSYSVMGWSGLVILVQYIQDSKSWWQDPSHVTGSWDCTDLPYPRSTIMVTQSREEELTSTCRNRRLCRWASHSKSLANNNCKGYASHTRVDHPAVNIIQISFCAS